MVKALIILFIVGVLAESALFAAVCACSRIRREARVSDVIIVLGAKVHADGALSETLRHRLDVAARAYHANIAPYIITCGAQGADEPKPEAESMRDYLISKGVPESAIYMEARSVNTITNLTYAKEIMTERGFKTAVIATSDYHMTRALYVAGELGIQASALPAPSPSSAQVFALNRFRETLSWLNTFLLWRH